ncbi:hypothetical protein D3C78_1865560 [compost metagenome]
MQQAPLGGFRIFSYTGILVTAKLLGIVARSLVAGNDHYAELKSFDTVHRRKTYTWQSRIVSG